MNRPSNLRIPLYLLGLTACALLGNSTGHWLAAFVALLLIDCLVSPRQAKAYANVLGTLTPNVIVARALELVFTVRPMLRAISLNFADLDTGVTEANYGATVYGRTLGIPTVQNFRAAATDRADADIPVTLNNFKQLFYTFTPEEYSGTSRNLIDEAAMPLAVAFANYMVDAIGALWTAANFANKTVVAAGWSYTNTLLEVRKQLKIRGVPQASPWFFVGDEDVYTSLLADPLIVAYLNNQRNADAIATGILPGAAGLMLDEYPSLPAAAGVKGFGGAADSALYAQRVPKNPESIPGFDAKFPGNIEIITEPRTKLSVMLNQYIGTDLSANIRLVWMNGIAKGNNNNGQRLTVI